MGRGHHNVGDIRTAVPKFECPKFYDKFYPCRDLDEHFIDIPVLEIKDCGRARVIRSVETEKY